MAAVVGDVGGSEEDASTTALFVAAKMVVGKGGSVDGVVALVKAVESAGGSGMDVGRALAEVVEGLLESKGVLDGSKCES